MRARALFRILGVCYGLVGLVLLLTLAVNLRIGFTAPASLIRAPASWSGLIFVLFLVLELLVGGVCIAVAYAFLRRRRWGRKLAIMLNGTLLTIFGASAGTSIVQSPGGLTAMEAPLGLLVAALIVVFLGGVIVLCCGRVSRELMDR